MDQEIITILGAGILGLCLGSFINVLVHRLPLGKSIVWPGSSCPNCSTPIRPLDNIPLLSYMILKGRCRSCSYSISPVYPLVELFTGLVVAVLFALNGLTINFFVQTLLAVIIISASVIDIQHLIIPNRITYTGIVLGLLLSFRWGFEGILIGIGGALTGIMLLLSMYIVGKLLFKREAVGFGDFKFVAAIGLFVGPFWSATIIFISILTGGIWGVGLIATRRYEAGKEVPFGPFIAIGTLSVFFFENQILTFLDYYLKLF